MASINDREKAFEAKFALDEELRFKAEARRNKLLGLWAAGLLGKSGDDADAYAKEVVAADFEEAGHEDVVRKVKADFDAAGVARSEDEIRLQMVELLAVAVSQIEAG
ncbi:DUF1476 family protein [Shinella sp. AETb1-6]|uniref:DUF1476 domain-containing protein n=1 Tax=Shinella sumterensis TaxID=1967501 RepID=A0AA50CQA9_9HYPH|nr:MULTISPECIES: DUF1476 domain-containing protein [Shinella]MDP9591146.1 hypothetical protein [Shinella zoogloeoides]MCD1266534.1 DUF1476 family protein [Shinella sumterensis]MXN53609.1 DUF1476 family protein [Shinella sp. AETb1-6]TFE96753.1 hypothetical protein B5M44_18630 [Shinella sumterensis]WLR98486.1 DUF1476 domain-containing protein [Shinella sumterensis]